MPEQLQLNCWGASNKRSLRPQNKQQELASGYFY